MDKVYNEEIGIYERDFTVASYEVGASGYLKPVYLLRYLQEAAREHAARLGISVPELQKRNLTWYISRYHIVLHKVPRYEDGLHINTWLSFREKRFSLREFELFDAENKVMGAVTSSWVLMDLEKKRPVMSSDYFPHVKFVPRRALEDPFDTIPKFEQGDRTLEFRVRMHDIDINRHVNNTVYGEWGVESVPKEILLNFMPKELEISFRGEALYGDRVISSSKVIEEGEHPVLLHKIVSENTGKEITRLRTRWGR